MFDEHYYVHDANALLHGGLAGTPGESWKPAGVRSDAHPDLGKLAIAAGIVVLGNDPWGWRVPAALAGIALIALVFPLGRRLGLTDEWALAALVLAAADPMLMLESRPGGARHLRRARHCPAVSTSLCGTCRRVFGCRGWWRVRRALGAAVACKWSGLLAIPAVLLVLVPPLVRSRGRVRALPVVGVLRVRSPLGVYLLSSVPYFAAGHGPGDWLRLQEHMATFGWGVKGDRSFASAPPTWPFDVHPIWYKWLLGEARHDRTPGDRQLPAVVGRASRRGSSWGCSPSCAATGDSASFRPSSGRSICPWLLTTRQTYIYYMVPVVPFLAILVATALGRIAGTPWAVPPGAQTQGADGVVLADAGDAVGEHRIRRLAAWGFCLACAVVGTLYVPFVLGVPVPFDYYVFLTPFTTWK